MLRIKSAKTFFLFAVLLFVLKPFLGFGIFSRMHPPAEENIFVKVFSKRKVEFSEDGSFNLFAEQKKVPDPVERVLVCFSLFLGMLFPVVFARLTKITNRVLRGIQLSLSQPMEAWLLNSKLII